MDVPKPETSGVQPTTVPKEAVVSSTDSKPTNQKAPATIKDEIKSKSTTSPASDVNKPATSTSTSIKPPVANTTMEPKQPPPKQYFTMGVVPQASASTVPLANFKKAATTTTPAIPKVPLPAVNHQPSSSKPVETKASPPTHTGSVNKQPPATAKPSNPPKQEELAPAKPTTAPTQEEEQSTSPPKQAEKASSVRPPTPNLAQPQTLLTRSLINPNFVDAQVSAKRRLRGEQDDEEDEVQKESIFSRASKIMLQKQAEEEDSRKQQATKTTTPPSQKQKNPPPPAPKPDKHVPVVEEYVEPAIKEEDLVDNHRLPASPTESFHSVQAPIKESRAHMPSRTNRQGRTSASSTRHVAPAVPHASKQSTKQSLPKYERDRSASSKKQYRRGNTRQEEEEDVEEIDTENLARVRGNNRYEDALFDDLMVSAHEFFRPSTHPSMHFDVDDDNSQDEEDSEYDSSEYLGSSYEGEDFDYGEEDGEYDSQEEEDEEGEEEDYSEQPTEGEGEGIAHQSSLPALKEMADINNHPKALIRLFADCEEQTALVEVLGKMRRFMAEFKDAFIKTEHEAIKELCISENEIAQEMMTEYEAQLKAFKERVLFLNAMARMIDIRHSFYEEFKATFSRHEPLTQTFETFDSELSESFHKEKQMMHRKERRHSSNQDESSSKHKRRHRKHATEDQISESEDHYEEAPQPHLPTEAEYFAQKKKFEAEQAQLQAYAAERLRRESAGEQPNHRTKSHHTHRSDAGKRSTSRTKSSHRSSRR